MDVRAVVVVVDVIERLHELSQGELVMENSGGRGDSLKGKGPSLVGLKVAAVECG